MKKVGEKTWLHFLSGVGQLQSHLVQLDEHSPAGQVLLQLQLSKNGEFKVQIML